jgi:hypothetical protein
MKEDNMKSKLDEVATALGFMAVVILIVVIAWLLFGCDGGQGADGGADSGADPDVDTDADGGTDAGEDTEVDAGTVACVETCATPAFCFLSGGEYIEDQSCETDGEICCKIEDAGAPDTDPGTSTDSDI